MHTWIISESCWIKPKSDCIQDFTIDLEPNEIPFGSKRNSVWLRINLKMVKKIWVWFYSTRFRKIFLCAWVRNGRKFQVKEKMWKVFLSTCSIRIYSARTFPFLRFHFCVSIFAPFPFLRFNFCIISIFAFPFFHRFYFCVSTFALFPFLRFHF